MKIISKASSNKHLLWLDLEAGGLDYENQPIIEIAAIVTEGVFKEVAEFYELIKISADQIEKMEKGAIEMHQKNGLLKKLSQGISKEKAEVNLRSFIDLYWKQDQKVILAGNSVYFDRLYLRYQMPQVGERLSHRVLDVSAWKTFFQMSYQVDVKKEAPHLAMNDIRLSMQELEIYANTIDSSQLQSQIFES